MAENFLNQVTSVPLKEMQRERQKQSFSALLLQQFLQFPSIFEQGRWEANINPFSIDLAFMQRREFNSCKTFSLNVTAFVTKTGLNLSNK